MVEKTDQAVDYLARVALVARGLTASLEPSEIVEIVVRQGMAGLDAAGAVLALVEPNGIVMPVEMLGYTKDAVAAFAPMSIGLELPLTVAVRDREPVWVTSRADAAARFPALAEKTVSGTQAWAAIPLVADGSVLGVLGVSFSTPHDFSEAERLLLSTLGDQCALALVSARTRRASPRTEIERDDPLGGAGGAARAVRVGDVVITSALGGHSAITDVGLTYPTSFDEQVTLAARRVTQRLQHFGCTAEDIVDATLFLHPSVDADPALLADRLHTELFAGISPALSLATSAASDAALVRIKVIAYKTR